MAGSPSGTAGVTGSSGGAGGESAVGGAAGEPNDISGAGAATEGGAGGQGGAGGASACEDGALKFSGAHYVDVPGTAALHLKTAMTLEAWVKTTDPVAVEAIFLGKHSCGTDNGYFLEIYTSSSDGPHVPNAPAFYVGANNQHAYGTASIVDGKWHHIAGTWDGATSKLYVDGAFVVSKAAAYVNTNPTNLGIGAVTGGTCRGFSGILDELSVWSVVRSAQEIAADAAAPVSKAAAGLEAYYDFNSSNCGQTLSDRSPHARDGVLGGSLMVEAADPQWVSDGPF